MKFLIELDGVVCSLAQGYHAAHREAAAAVGWSALDQVTFWRLTRTKGREAVLLPGAKPQKLKDYHARFDAILETDAHLDAQTLQDGAKQDLASLAQRSECRLLTLGTNAAGRARLLTRLGLARWSGTVETLSGDPRARPAQLTALAGSDGRTAVVGASDGLLRSASAAGLVCMGIASGACSEPRLHQAGAAIVFKDLRTFVAAVEDGSPELLRAGLRPAGPIFSR